MDGLVGPVARQAQLPPRTEVTFRTPSPFGPPTGAIPAATALRAKDAVELLHGNLREWIIAVHDHAKTRLPSRNVIRAGCNIDFNGAAVGIALIQLQLAERDLAANADIGNAKHQRGNCRQRCLHVKIEKDVGMIFLESRLPIAAQKAVRDVVAAPQAQRTADLLFREVRR